MSLKSEMTALANSIRAKAGGNALLSIAAMKKAVDGISVGSTVTVKTCDTCTVSLSWSVGSVFLYTATVFENGVIKSVSGIANTSPVTIPNVVCSSSVSVCWGGAENPDYILSGGVALLKSYDTHYCFSAPSTAGASGSINLCEISYTWKKYECVATENMVMGEDFTVKVEKDTYTTGNGVRTYEAYGLDFPCYNTLTPKADGTVSLSDICDKVSYSPAISSLTPNLYDGNGAYFRLSDLSHDEFGTAPKDKGTGYAIVYRECDDGETEWDDIYNCNECGGEALAVVIKSFYDYSAGAEKGTATSTNPEAFPVNGRHSDGFYYIRQ